MIIVSKGGRLHTQQGSAQYNGDKTGNEFADWVTYNADPNEFIKCSYGELSDRNVTLFHTSSLARACVNKPISYSIGDGLLFKSMINKEIIGINKDQALDFSQRFTRLLHYEKMAVNWYEKQPLSLRESKIAGDSLIYFLREDDKFGRPFDLIVSGGHNIDWTKSDANTTLGIAHDQYSRRTGLWRVGAKEALPFTTDDGFQNVIQLLTKQRAGQMRGYGAFYSNIAHAKNMDRVWDATVERMVMESLILASAKSTDTSVAEQLKELAELARQNKKNGSSADFTPESAKSNLPTGSILQFKNGESFDFTDLKTPSDNFDVANEWSVNYFGMSTGVPPEVMLSKYGTSFTAHKGALNDFKKMFMQERATYTRTAEQRVNLEYLKHFVLTDQIQVVPEFWTDYKVQMAYLAGTYLGPVPGHINPLQEVNAYAKADEKGYMLKSQVAANYDNDFENMIDQWGVEQNLWYGLDPENSAQRLNEDNEARDKNGNLIENTQKPSGKLKKLFSLGRKS